MSDNLGDRPRRTRGPIAPSASCFARSKNSSPLVSSQFRCGVWQVPAFAGTTSQRAAVSCRSTAPHDHAHRHPLCRIEARGSRGVRHLRHGRRSRPRHFARHHQVAAEGGRRRHRARHAVYRSDGRRPVDPGGWPARAESRHHAEEDAQRGARLPHRGRRDTDRADGLLQPDLHLRRRQISRRRQDRRRGRFDHRRPAAGGR